ncbi:unnamed protein product, partial [marine sediment metagenome]
IRVGFEEGKVRGARSAPRSEPNCSGTDADSSVLEIPNIEQGSLALL